MKDVYMPPFLSYLQLFLDPLAKELHLNIQEFPRPLDQQGF